MKNLLLISFILPLLFSCSKTWDGCTDHKATNFDEDAEKHDDSCVYTKLTFYADSSRFGGIPINSIEVTIDGESIGSFSKVYSSGGPSLCSADGTVSFDFVDAGNITWKSTIYLNNGTTNSATGIVGPTQLNNCRLISALP